MDSNEWPDIVPIVQSVLNWSPSTARKNLAPVTIFLGMHPNNLLSSFKRSKKYAVPDSSAAMTEITRGLTTTKTILEELHPIVNNALQQNRKLSREVASQGVPAKFMEGDFVLVARQNFFKGEKLALRGREPRRVVKTVSNYVYNVEDLRNGSCSDVHARHLRFFADCSLDQEAAMSHAVRSETGMPVSKLLRLFKKVGQLFVQIHWKGLDVSEDADEPLAQVYEDVPKLLLKLLAREFTPSSLEEQARDELGL